MSDKIAFTVIFPDVPSLGSPVIRVMEYFVAGEKVQTLELPLTEAVVRFVIPYDTEGRIYTRTADKAGNWSVPSLLPISGIKDMTPPPMPPAPQVAAGTMVEVSEPVGCAIVPPEGVMDEKEEEEFELAINGGEEEESEVEVIDDATDPEE